MEIIKRTNIFVKTERRLVIQNQPVDETVECRQCPGQMIAPGAAASFFGVSRRAIYRFIEREEIHFIETETNEIYVCPISIKDVLESIRAAG